MNSALSSMVRSIFSAAASGPPSSAATARSMRAWPLACGPGSPCSQTFGAALRKPAVELERAHELRCDDHVPGRDDVDAVGKRSAGEIGVEERDGRAGARKPEPDREILRPIRHQQGDDVALGDALLQRPTQVAARSFGERPVAQGFAGGYQRRLVAVGVGELVDDDRKNAARIAHDRRRAPQRAQPGAKINQVARQSLEHRSSCAARFETWSAIRERDGAIVAAPSRSRCEVARPVHPARSSTGCDTGEIWRDARPARRLCAPRGPFTLWPKSSEDAPCTSSRT